MLWKWRRILSLINSIKPRWKVALQNQHCVWSEYLIFGIHGMNIWFIELSPRPSIQLLFMTCHDVFFKLFAFEIIHILCKTIRTVVLPLCTVLSLDIGKQLHKLPNQNDILWWMAVILDLCLLLFYCAVWETAYYDLLASHLHLLNTG